MFGGPLKIPKLLSGQHGMFTFNYQLGRTRNGTTQSALMPTALERTGDFSQSFGQLGPVTIFDPLHRAALSRKSDSGQPLQLQRRSGGAAEVLSAAEFHGRTRLEVQLPGADCQRRATRTTSTRGLNQTLNSKNRLSGGFGYQRSNGTTPNLFEFIDGANMTGYNANVGWSHNFTTRLISNLSYRFSRSNSHTLPYFANRDNVAADLGIDGTLQLPVYWGPPSLSFHQRVRGVSPTSNRIDQPQPDPAVGDSLIWIHGTHNITFGGDFRRQQFNPLSEQNARGSFSFTGSPPAAPASPTAATISPTSCWDCRTTSSIAYGNADKYFRASWFDALRQRRLAHQQPAQPQRRPPLGLRRARDGAVQPPGGPGYRARLHGDRAGAARADRVALAALGYADSLVQPRPQQLLSRASALPGGPSPRRSTVVRGGYGIYYNTSVYSAIANQMAQQPPLSVASRWPALRRPADAAERVSGCPGHRDHQHLRHRPELSHRLRADLDRLDPAEPAQGDGPERLLPRDQGHAPRSAVPAELGSRPDSPAPSLTRRATSTSNPTAIPLTMRRSSS